MLKSLSALLAGLVFGIGLTVSQMINPKKVLGFLDIFGGWDPSLAFVMGGALLITLIGYKIVTGLKKPILTDTFQLPLNQDIDRRLVIGAIIFGIGWGLIGLCPGPAIAAITIGGTDVYIFVGAMFAGMASVELFNRG